MKVKKLLSAIFAGAMALGTMSISAMAAGGTVNDSESFAAAVADAQVNNGVLTYKISGNVDYTHESNGHSLHLIGTQEDVTKIVIEGIDESATLNVTGYNGANGADNDINPDAVAIEIKNIKITDNQDHYTSDAGWAVVSVAGDVTLTNVTTEEVSLHFDYASSNVTINGGTYNGPTGYYPIFIDNITGDFTITGATINSARGIKIGDARYTAFSGKVTIEDCTFSNLYKKPAVNISHVSSDASIAINSAKLNNCTYGLLANEVADSNVTVDGKEPAYVAEWNGNRYTNLDYANAEAAEKGETAEALIDAAKIGETKYSTLEAALTAAADGDEIVLLADVTISGRLSITKAVTIDLGGNTMTFSQGANNYISADTTIKNGRINMSNVNFTGNGILWVGYHDVSPTLVLNDVDLVANNITGGGQAVIQMYNASRIEIINGSTLTAENTNVNYVIAFDNAQDGRKATITDSTITLKGVVGGLYNAEYEITNSTITMTDISGRAFRNVSGAIANSNITVNGCESGIKNTDGKTLTIENNSTIDIKNTTGASGDNYCFYTSGSTIDADSTSTLISDDGSHATLELEDVTATTKNIGAETGDEDDSTATGFVTAITSNAEVELKTIQWSVTSGNTTNTSDVFEINNITANGVTLIGLMVNGLADTNATATAVING